MSPRREVRSQVGLMAGLSSLDFISIFCNVDMIGVDILVVHSLFILY